MPLRLFLAGSVVFLLLMGTADLHAAIDSTLFTTYVLQANATRIDLTVCGSLPGTSGCYGSGSLGQFGRVGAMIEGNPKQNLKLGTVTRFIYVVDTAYGANGNQVALCIYKKVDTINGGDDTVSVSLFKTVPLPLTGGAATVASMAANPTFLYIGTNQDELAVQVQKSNLAISQFGAVSGPYSVTSITADRNGFVTVTWGNGAGFLVVDKNGNGEEDGGGNVFVLNGIQGKIPAQ